MVAQRDGTIVAADATVIALLGVPGAALIGRRWPSFLTPASLDAYAEAQAAIASGFRWLGRLEWRLRERPITLQIEALTTGPDDVVVLRAWPVQAAREEATATEATIEAPIDPIEAPAPPSELPPPIDAAAAIEAEVEALRAAAALHDARAAARAVLQAVARPIPLDFAVVLAAEGDALEVLATYPAAMAGIEAGLRWSPPGDAERRLLTSGEPSLEGNGDLDRDPASPLSRLAAFGMRSAVRVPLYRGTAITGVAAVFAARRHAFGVEHGVLVERLVRPLGARLASPPRTTLEAASPLEAAPIVRARDIEDDLELSPAERLSERFERLSGLGDLVSGAAHELNNPLTAIVGYSQMLPGLSGDERDRALRTIEDEALRASRIVRHLLSFARRQRPQLAPVDLNAVIRRVVDVREYSLELDRIEVTLVLEELPPVPGDEFQLEQVLLNLLANAHQALAGTGGAITIRSCVHAGRARIEVADTGPGVPPELAERIFDPFFTTREVGSGSGMGLATVYGTVTEHGGHVWTERAPSGGALFVVELPLTATPPAPQPDTPAATPPLEDLSEAARTPRGHGQRILVVDDEAPIRTVTREILSSFGYEPIEAASGRDALALLEAGPFDAAVLDVRMPGMDGIELYEEIARRWPALRERVLFITGDSQSERAASLLASGDVPYLEKPFRMRDLLDSLSRLLGTA